MENLLKENSLTMSRNNYALKEGKIINEQRQRYIVESEGGEFTAILSGKLRHFSLQRSELPTVGDLVLIQVTPGQELVVIEEVLPRKSQLTRKLAGEYAGEQLLGANIDIVFLLNSLNRDLNLRRIERYLVMIRDGGIKPVIILTKSDLVSKEQALQFQEEIKKISRDEIVLKCSINDPESISRIKELVHSEMTVALLGSSGVGKSTLTNLLLGSERQTTQEIGQHAERGKHTTTSRSLLKLENGAYLMDTPGIREIQLWEGSGGFEFSFSDIIELEKNCKFTNCRHQDDFGCAIQNAIENGALDQARLKSFLKIEREQAFMKQRSQAKHSKHQKEIWKKRSREYRR